MMVFMSWPLVIELQQALISLRAAVVENSPVGTVIGMLGAIDPDYGDSFTFELVAGDGDRDNSSFSVDNEQLVAATGFDFEAGATRSIRCE